MFGFDPVTASSLLIMAGTKVTCPDREPTKINIVPHTAEVQYDYSQSLRDIQNYQTDTVDPYGFHGQTVTQGFMKGQIGLEQKIRFGQSKNPRYGYACVWYHDITVNIHIDPKIVIARELYHDPCMRRAIINHELKHVRVDREIVNKYAKSMGNKLMSALKSRGFSAGPFDLSRLPEVQSKMQRVVHQVLELEYQKLGIERQERQRAVDSRAEYDSVDQECPDFKKRKSHIYSDLLR